MLSRLGAWLDSATRGELRDDAGPIRARRLSVAVVVAAAGLLAQELVLARIYPVFLGNVSAFLAIPAAMFGLSLGALFQHLRVRDHTPREVAVGLPLLGVTMFGGLLLLFWLFNEVFNLTHHQLQDPARDALKTTALLLVVTPSFAVGGALLSSAFSATPKEVGRLYSWDLVGSAGACVAVPLLLRGLGLPLTLVAMLLAVGSACWVVLSGYRRRLGLLLGLASILLVAGAASGRLFNDRPDPHVLGVRYANGRAVRELRHAWNEISRVAVVRFGGGGQRRETRLIHDDGISNVMVRSWRAERIGAPRDPGDLYGLPWALGVPPKRALVVFAGVGQDMMRLYEHAGGNIEVRGVELNPLVPRLAMEHDDPWHLQAFYDQPGVDLRIDEGRALLERDRTKYDLILAASNGAQHAARLGHARRFLDTREALQSYLDHLAPGGLIVLHHQPFDAKIEMLKTLLPERGFAPLPEAVAVLGGHRTPTGRVDTLVLRPDGLTDAMAMALRELAGAGKLRLHYLRGEGALKAAVESPPDPAVRIPTDDRPYERSVDFAGFSLRPGRERLTNPHYALSWIKVFTVALFSFLSLLVAIPLVLVPRGGRRLPAAIVLWLLLSGVAYMQAQIGLMGRLELFLGQPIYAIAVVLAAFLLANAAGARAVGAGLAGQPGMRPFWPPLLAAASLPLTLGLLRLLLEHAIGLPTPVKAVLGALAVAPLAFVLGMFYPLAATAATGRGLSRLIPATFGLATLSGAVGGAWATVAVIDWGFSGVVLGALPLYLVLIPLAFFLAPVPGVARGERGSRTGVSG